MGAFSAVEMLQKTVGVPKYRKRYSMVDPEYTWDVQYVFEGVQNTMRGVNYTMGCSVQLGGTRSAIWKYHYVG